MKNLTFRKIFRARIRDCAMIEFRRLDKNRKQRERKALNKKLNGERMSIIHKVNVQQFAFCKNIRVVVSRNRCSKTWDKVNCKLCYKKKLKKEMV